MMERQLAAEIAAMRLLEEALEQDGQQHDDFIAGSAHPVRVRKFALRLLKRTTESDSLIGLGASDEFDRFSLRYRMSG